MQETSGAALRTLWSSPDTRKRLLSGLAEKGFGQDQLAEMQKIINAEKSDLFDVLAYVAYALPPLAREERATRLFARSKLDPYGAEHLLNVCRVGFDRNGPAGELRVL